MCIGTYGMVLLKVMILGVGSAVWLEIVFCSKTNAPVCSNCRTCP